MTPCESTRGEWGQVCPDCHQMLPRRQPPLSSWHSQRNLDEVRSENATRTAPPMTAMVALPARTREPALR